MRLLTCGDSNFYGFLSVLLKSNKIFDNFDVTVADWGLKDEQIDDLKEISKFDHKRIEYPKNERMLSKVLSIMDAITTYQDDILYLDADFMFASKISDKLDNIVDICVTYLYKNKKFCLNAGFFAAKYNNRSIDFVEKWIEESSKNADWWGDQDSLTGMTKRFFPRGNGDIAHVTYLPCKQYNAVPSCWSRDAKLIHLKGKRWHDILIEGSPFPAPQRPEELRWIYEMWKKLQKS